MSSVELWTAAGAGGVAVVVLRGPGARGRLARLGVGVGQADPEWPGRSCTDGPAPRLVRLRDGGEDLDEALLVEGVEGERLELHLHGSPPLVERVLAVLRDAEVDPGPAGGRERQLEPRLDADGSDLAQRAWRRLGDAPSELGARVLLDQAQGAFGAWVERLEGLSALELSRAAAELLERGRVARFLLERSTVALVGPVNAGKSTLFNLLLGAERTVVSPELGTTRDAISEPGHLGPWPVLLVDTAGQRPLASGDSRHAVEREGQRLAEAVGREADWVLELARASEAQHAELRRANARLLTCCDELGEDPRRWPAAGISVRTRPGRAVKRVRELFEARFRLSAGSDGPWCPGAAVPFERGQMRALEALAEAARRPRSAGRLAEALRRLGELAR